MMKCDRRRYEANREERSWPRFWFDILHVCPSGPTLFDVDPPLAPWNPELSSRASARSFNPGKTPRYLFRVFDRRSPGLNNETTMASQASKDEDPDSRVDILSLDNMEAASLLHQHLNKQCHSVISSDNLVSWTTSLLFALQYAIWRHRHHGSSPGSIFICVVDTAKFPRGQFMQDKRLIRKFKDTASNEAQDFFHFRMGREDYYNGEYLSQGSLRYSGRGYSISLERLENSGLYELYPEFREPEGFHAWTNRVRDLRSQWQSVQLLHQEYFDRAARLATNCFKGIGGIEIALMLVCFKARKLTDTASNGTPWAPNPPPPPPLACSLSAHMRYRCNSVWHTRMGEKT